MFKSNLKTAIKSLWKNKFFSAINIIGLSIGMTAAVLIFWWVQNEMSYDSFHPDSDRIYRTTAHLTKSSWVWESSPLPLAETASGEIPDIEMTSQICASWYSSAFNLNGEFFKEKKGAYVDKNWFRMFHYDFLKGNAAAFFQNPFSILLTESKAKKYFGNGEPIGQIIRIDTLNFTVQAVVRDNPSNSSFQFDILMPLDAYLSNPQQRKNDNNWGNFNYLTFVKLRKNVKPERVASKLTELFRKNNNESNVVSTLTSLKDLHFETQLTSPSFLTHANRKTVYVFSILAIVLLVIACINYVNLTTAKASIRAKEVSIKKIIGAQRWNLFGQFITESLLVSFIALSISAILVWLMLPLFNQIAERSFSFSPTSASLWKVLLGTLVATTILNGIYPALLLSSFKPLNVFKGITILKVKDATFRKGLVVFQFTLSVTLIAATIIITRQLKYIQEKDLGYDRSQVFSFSIPYKYLEKYSNDTRKGLFNSIKHELQSHTSIEGVSMASGSIVNLNSRNSGSADWDGRDSSYVPSIFQLSADEDFKDVFQLKLIEGRWFDAGNKSDEKNYILNETAVNEFNIHTPLLGQRFSFHGDTGQIIGVVKDFNFKSLHDKIGPVAIFNKANWRDDFFVRTTPLKTAAALDAVKTIWKRFVPDDPFEYSFLDEAFNKLYKADRKTSSLIRIFSIIAIIISSLGLLGLATFASEQRKKEIGIRKVIGAGTGNIISLLSKDFLKLVIIAIFIAWPFAWWIMNKWLEGFAYRITVGWQVFILAGVFALLIALITVSFQAIKVAVANPVKSLRTE